MKTLPDDYLDPLHSIGYLARINFRAFSRELERQTLKHGISAGQWRFLRVLWEQDDVTQRELSDRVGIKEATTVKAVNSLVEAGLVERHPSAEDKRKIHIRLTRKARRLRDKLLPIVAQVNEQALAGIPTADVETTRRVLARTFANLNAQPAED